MSTCEKLMHENELVPPLSEADLTRNVIFLFDGTGDKIDDDISNVAKFARALHNCPLDEHRKVAVKQIPDNDDKQIVIYRPGIGTWFPGSIGGHLPWISESLDKAVAWNFESHVMDAYKTLVKIYRDGDRISLLGFSRGAYTARTVAALVAFFGLLPAESNENDFKVLQDAYFAPSRNHYLYQGYCALKDYLFRPEHSSDVGPFNKDARKRFREDADTFCSRYKTRPVDIDFVGVWDTVNSVGLVTAAEAMFTSTNPKLRVLRHAIALDERRARFDRAMWRIKPKDEAKKDSLETKPVKPYPRKEQVWFAGAHCDVGGGAVLNDTRHSLACIPLRWMIRECFKTETGIIFDRQTLKDIGFDPTSLYPVVRPRPAPLPLHEDAVIQYAPSRWSWPFGSKEQQNSENAPVKTEEEHDHDDALAPVYDQLEVGYYSWNLLEIVPVKKWNSVTRKQTRDFNLRSGRVIDVHINKVDDQNNPLPEKEWKRLPPIKVHHTVKMRMHAKGGPGKGKYIPAAKLDFKGGMDLEADIDSDLVEWVY